MFFDLFSGFFDIFVTFCKLGLKTACFLFSFRYIFLGGVGGAEGIKRKSKENQIKNIKILKY